MDRPDPAGAGPSHVTISNATSRAAIGTSPPQISIVVIGYAPPGLLAECLDALRKQTQTNVNTPLHEVIEVLVVAPATHMGEALGDVQFRVPEFTWIDAPAGYNVAHMRGLGIARSSAPVVALIEGDCRPSDNYVEQLMALTPTAATGGAVEPCNFTRSIDWAAYFCEFAKFLTPLPARVDQLPGANVVYQRAALPDAAQLERDGLYETFVNAALGDRHVRAYDSQLVVVHQRTWRIGDAIRARYHHGRGFAALRVQARSTAQRLPFMGLALVLPVVLMTRVLSEPWRRRRFVGRSLVVSPWIAVLSCSWAVGEFMGYAAGPGSSLDNWR